VALAAQHSVVPSADESPMIPPLAISFPRLPLQFMHVVGCLPASPTDSFVLSLVPRAGSSSLRALVKLSSMRG